MPKKLLTNSGDLLVVQLCCQRQKRPHSALHKIWCSALANAVTAHGLEYSVQWFALRGRPKREPRVHNRTCAGLYTGSCPVYSSTYRSWKRKPLGDKAIRHLRCRRLGVAKALWLQSWYRDFWIGKVRARSSKRHLDIAAVEQRRAGPFCVQFWLRGVTESNMWYVAHDSEMAQKQCRLNED